MTEVREFWQNLKRFASENFFPEKFRCLLCDVEIFEGELCADCLKSLRLNDSTTCPKCGRKTAKSEICIECKAHLPAYDRAFSPLVYEDGSAALVGAFKNGRPYIAKYLSDFMVEKINGISKVDGIVYVPVSDRALYKRGYNHSKLLAEAASAATRIPVLCDAVVKIKETPDQKDLSRARRLKNLLGCFKADAVAVKGKTIVVIDDVMTTGGTADSIAQTLKNAGAGAVFVITAASVEYKK